MDARVVERELIELDEVPLLGGAPPFPLEQVATDLGHRFQLELHLEAGVPEWVEAEAGELSVGLGLLDGHALFCMDAEEAQAAMRLLLGGDRYGQAVYDSTMREAFVRFLALEVLHAAETAGYPPDLNPRVEEDVKLEGKVLAIALRAETHGQTMGGRLLLSQELLKNWRAHFAERKPHHLSEELRQTLEVSVGVEIGQTELDLTELRSLEAGDVMLLDQHTEGRVGLMLGTKRLGEGAIEGRTITVGG